MPLPLSEAKRTVPRSGDRVLVLKTLYPFFEPKRFDVVVFKNPTDTQGAAANYIKRLIGLPNETLWIVDGDIFAKKGDSPFLIQRKPEHIQQALWREVSDSDAVPTDKLSLTRPWQGPPWQATPSKEWSLDDRTWKYSGESAQLKWDHRRMPIDDWLPYNVLMTSSRKEPPVPMSDIRVSATITPSTDNLKVTFILEAVGQTFTWDMQGDRASLARSSQQDPSSSVSFEFDIEPLRARKPTRVEFWHVDQMLAMFVDGERVGELLYDFGPQKRLRLATGSSGSVPIEDIAGSSGSPPSLRWECTGSSFVMSRVTLDHDLYYRSGQIPDRAVRNPTTPGNEKLVEVDSPAFGTHPEKLAVLGSNQFMMAGDNSAFSLDVRLWGNPDVYVAAQIDTAPFVVNRDLLIGKAWCVYWPSAFRIFNTPLIPDFGSIRFIR